MSNITDLQGRLESLRLLLADPHPGLFTWRMAYERAANRLLEFFDADPDAAERVRYEACPKCGHV